MTDATNPEPAIITPISQGGDQDLQPVTVQFNPASLVYNLRNNIQKRGRGARARQHVSQTTATLAVDLIFDTTHTGQDVRIETVKIAQYLQPYDGRRKTPPTVRFEWGTFVFEGYVESYKETIDFFAPAGVPLRSTLNVTFTSKDKQFETRAAAENDEANVEGALSGLDSAVVAPAPERGGSGGSPTTGSASDTAAQGGDPGAAKALAQANGLENLRFPDGPLAVGAGAEIGAAAAFSAGASASFGVSAGASAGFGASAEAGASAGAGFGAGASAGFGASAGASAGFGASAEAGASAGAGFGAGAGASAGFGASAGASAEFGASAGASAGATFGASASAGVSASAGAFSGLHSSTSVKKTTSLNTSKIVKGSVSSAVSTDAGASFKVGGQAEIEGSASLSANVSAKLEFDSD
jgi:hypothetical protein